MRKCKKIYGNRKKKIIIYIDQEKIFILWVNGFELFETGNDKIVMNDTTYNCWELDWDFEI